MSQRAVMHVISLCKQPAVMNKLRLWIKAIWKDPVWSKVISAIIIAAGIGLWALITKRKPHDLYEVFLRILNWSIPLYVILSLIGLVFLYRIISKRLKKKPDPLYSEMIGHYTFSELVQILENEKTLMNPILPALRGSEPIEANLIQQLMLYRRELNMGVTFELPHGSNYLYADFCPKMMTYGLIDKIPGKHDSGIDMETYQLSELGKKFISLWERHLLIVNNK